MPIFGLPAIFEKGERDVHDEPRQALGSCYIPNTDDTTLCYVRFAEDVTEGDVIRTKYAHYSKTNLSPQTNGGSVYAPAGTQIITEHDATYEASLNGSSENQIPPEPTLRDYAKIAITDGTGVGQRGYITHYTNKVLNIRWYDTDDGTLKTALDGTSDYEIFAPWLVEKAFADAASATEAATNGIVLARSAKAGQYGLVGVEGDFPVRVNATVDAGDVLIPAVVAQKGRAEPAVAADAPNSFATTQHAGAAGQLVECTVRCEKISIVREVAESLIAGTPRPEAV